MEIPGIDDSMRQKFYKFIHSKSLTSKNLLSYSTHSYCCNNQTDENKFEYYDTKLKSTKLVIFIHGGAWKFSNLEASAYLAEYFLNSGFNFAPIASNPAINISISDMITEVRCAIKEILKVYQDQAEVYVMGHSSGAHLALSAVVGDTFHSNVQITDNEKSRLRGLILVSGTFDMKIASEDAYLGLSEEEAWQITPLICVEELKMYQHQLKVFIIVEDGAVLHFFQHSKDV